jgi:BlaI family transcriptional regulator, penicillinase repressor
MSIKVGAVQHRIMRVLWEEGEATARQITDVLSREKEIAHSTVQTLLRKLETKGVVQHERKDRTFVFRATVPEQEVSRSAVHDLLGRVFQGSVSGLVANLLENEDVPQEELKRLRDMVDERMREGKP